MKIKTSLFLISFFIFFGTTSTAATRIYVDPSSIINQPEYSISIKLDDVSDLAGFELKLYWDPAVLTYDHDDVVVGNIWSEYFQWKREYNNTGGYYYVGFTKKSSSSGFSGSGTLTVIYLRAINEGLSVLDLKDTKLGNSNALPIAHEVKDGIFSSYPCNSDGTLPDGKCHEGCGVNSECDMKSPNTKWCDGDIKKSCSSSCQYSETICRIDAEDSDGGKVYKVKGTCTDYTGCSGGTCKSDQIPDLCHCVPKCPYLGSPGCYSDIMFRCVKKSNKYDCALDANCTWGIMEAEATGGGCSYTSWKNCKDYGSRYGCSDGMCKILGGGGGGAKMMEITDLTLIASIAVLVIIVLMFGVLNVFARKKRLLKLVKSIHQN